jgi:hypothetical protein
MLEMMAAQTSAIAVIAASLTGGRPTDFLPDTLRWKGATRHQDQTLDQQRDTLVALTMAMGGTIPDQVRARWVKAEDA